MSDKRIQVRKLIEDKNPKLYRKLPNFVLRYLEKIVHEKEINDFLERHGHLRNQAFCEAIVNEFEIQHVVIGKEKIPKTGPVILVLNHPLGGLDGVAFIDALSGYRDDLIFIVNDILLNIDQLKDLFVGVNKHGKNESNTRTKIASIFSSDKAVCVFPAGQVSRVFDGMAYDSDWKKTFVTYARSTKNPIIPIHIAGKLSPFFYRLYKFRSFFKIKSNLEMLYLSDEMFKQKGKQLVFSVGDPIYLTEEDDLTSDLIKAQEIKQILYNIPYKK